MAKKKDDQKADYELGFPINGIDQNWAYSKQPVLTTPYCMNVRPYDVDENRARGGQRPGLRKAYSTQVSGTHPIIGMVQITTTYIPPE